MTSSGVPLLLGEILELWDIFEEMGVSQSVFTEQELEDYQVNNRAQI